MSQIEAVILDFDGVLAESNQEKDRAFEELAALYPRHREAMVAYHLAHYSSPRMEKFRYFAEELLEGRDADQLAESLAEQFSQLVTRRVIACPPVLGAHEFLREFAPRIPLYISSVTPHDELQTIVAARDISEYLVASFGNPPYPKDQAIRIVLERESLAPEQVAFVGDSVSDYEVAVASGLAFFGRQSDRPFDGVDIELGPDMFAVAGRLRGLVPG